MPSAKYGRTWEAEPHTLAKIEMLKAYLHAYFLILGRGKRSREILYVDGFAGPGEYTNSDMGSPIAALAAANSARMQIGSKWLAGTIQCAFIEPDSERCKNLRERIKPFEGNSHVVPSVIEDSFENGIAILRRLVPGPFTSDEPLFVFIDPFGATGVPFEVIANILASPCSEVLINLDADGIARIFAADYRANHEIVLNTLFGDDSWKMGLDYNCEFPALCQQVLVLYKTKLKALPRVKYTYSFEMRGPRNTLNYHLVFAGQNPLGLEKMKEAMRTIDQSGRYCFSDGNIGQATMFREDDPNIFAKLLYNRFLGTKVTYEILMDHALNETPFTNPKAMLRVLDSLDLLEVESTNPKRRRSDFNERTTLSVRFKTKVTPPSSQEGLFDG
jgi:three-Cys-motif partner protein